jgi:hypothetical protein
MNEFLMDWQKLDDFIEEASAGCLSLFVEETYNQDAEYTIYLLLPENDWRILLKRSFADNRDAAKHLCEAFAVQMASDLSPVANRAIRANIAARGYLAGKSDSKIIALQMAKFLEEIPEACEHVLLPRGLAEAIADMGRLAKEYFDNPDAWEGARVTNMASFLKEVDDIQVVHSTLCATLEYNAVEGGLLKSNKDKARGVRRG